MTKLMLSLLAVPMIVGSMIGQEVAITDTLKASDGVHLRYQSHGKGETALVFLHGWCGDRHWWKHQVPVFAKDYRVITLDQAGHGESGKNRQEWSIDKLADDVKTVVQTLGLKRVVLVGHSMGGPVSLAAAAKLPGVVVGVVGVDTIHNVSQKMAEDQVKHFIDGFENDFKGMMAMAFKGMLPEKTDPELVKSIVSRAEQQDKTMALAHMKSMFKGDAAQLLKDAKVPVRCINAAPGTIQFSQKTNVEGNQKHGDFNVVIMEGVGHFPMLEQPAAFNEKLATVLKEFK